MIPYDMDPSLFTSEPEPPQLDDGFSPPHRDAPPVADELPSEAGQVASELGGKSPF